MEGVGRDRKNRLKDTIKQGERERERDRGGDDSMEPACVSPFGTVKNLTLMLISAV